MKARTKRDAKVTSGSTTFGLRSERGLGWSGAPCQGYYSLVEHTAKDKTDRINCPRIFEVMQRIFGKTFPDFGSEFEVTVTVKVIKEGIPSKKKCHNPWPGHTCPAGTRRNRIRKLG